MAVYRGGKATKQQQQGFKQMGNSDAFVRINTQKTLYTDSTTMPIIF